MVLVLVLVLALGAPRPGSGASASNTCRLPVSSTRRWIICASTGTETSKIYVPVRQAG